MLAFSPERVQYGIDAAEAAGADVVVAFVHWGDNYGAVNEQQRYWAEQLAMAGYDAVIGAGSHAAQTVEYVNDVPVVYSMGNFAFGAPGRFGSAGQQGVGLTATVVLEQGQARAVEIGCLATDNKNPTVAYRARPCTPEEQGPAFTSFVPVGSAEGHVATVPFRK